MKTTKQRVTDWVKINKRRVTAGSIVLALVIYGTSGWYYWRKVYTSYENVYWGMVENSLRVQSVARQQSAGQDKQSFSQTLLLTTGAHPQVQGRSLFAQKQGSEQLLKGTELLGTPESDYYKYTALQGPKINGKAPDYSKSLNRWARESGSLGSVTDGKLFAEITQGIVPIGNLRLAQRTELMKVMQDSGVYDVNFSETTKQKVNGRQVYLYRVALKTEGYARVLKAFSKMIGTNQYDNLNPDDYKNAQSAQYIAIVDVTSRQLVGLQFGNGQRLDAYTGQGVRTQPWQIPKNPETAEKLEKELLSAENI
jgi:hypothetical protein